MNTTNDCVNGLLISFTKKLDSFYEDFHSYTKFYIKYWPVVKKMKSKSKQPRYVRVVMKGEWK